MLQLEDMPSHLPQLLWFSFTQSITNTLLHNPNILNNIPSHLSPCHRQKEKNVLTLAHSHYHTSSIYHPLTPAHSLRKILPHLHHKWVTLWFWSCAPLNLDSSFRETIRVSHAKLSGNPTSLNYILSNLSKFWWAQSPWPLIIHQSLHPRSNQVDLLWTSSNAGLSPLDQNRVYYFSWLSPQAHMSLQTAHTSFVAVWPFMRS